MLKGASTKMTKATVLIVDDEKNVRESLAKVFRGIGYEALLAANGDEALEIYRARRPDILLLDLNMPVRNGWDTFEQISTEHPLTPIVIITGRPGQLEIAAAARVGALMEKPLDVHALIQTVERLVEEPLTQRLSRLAFGEPRTLLFGEGPDAPAEAPPPELAAMRVLRKQQLDKLRSEAGA